MKLSNQAMGAIMMALQKALLEQTDIVPVLQSFNFQCDESEKLMVLNPPNFKIGQDIFNPKQAKEEQTIEENNTTVGSD